MKKQSVLLSLTLFLVMLLTLLPGSAVSALAKEQSTVIMPSAFLEETEELREEPEKATLSITSQPANVTTTSGRKATFKVTATGGTGALTYQWQYSADNGKTWASTSLDGSKTATLSFTTKTSLSGRRWRCVVTDSKGTKVTSNAALLTVNAEPSFTKQPSNITTTAGKTASFTVAVAGGTGTLSYQWQYSTDSGKTWANTSLNGSKTATLSFTAKESLSGRKWRCVVSDSKGAKIISNSVLLTVNAKPTIIMQPENVTTSAGQTAVFKISVSGGTGTISYQWQYSTDNGLTWANTSLNGSKTAILSFTAKENLSGRRWRCVVADSKGMKLTSDTALLSVNAKPSFTTQPVDAIVTSAKTVIFTVLAKGGTGDLIYQWQYSADSGKTWNNTSLNGSKTTELKFKAQDNLSGRRWRCIATDEKGAKAISGSALLTVKKAPTSSIPPGTSVSFGSTYAILEAYDPDGAFLVRNTDVSMFMFWFTGRNTIGEAINTFGSAVHEQCHDYSNCRGGSFYNPYTGKYMNKTERIFTGDGNSVIVNMTPCFDSREMVSEVPQEFRGLRFNTYIDTDDDTSSSRQQGIYGLLNEYTAYLWGLNTDNMLYYYKSVNQLLSDGTSDTYVAYAEFRYYILKYILYAKTHYPAVYNEILDNQTFCQAFTTVDIEFQKAIAYYRQHYNVGWIFETTYQALLTEMEKPEYKQTVQLLKP